jgi:acyl-CoA synthetase (AMP-forming)/AMP-acid ligase II
VPTRLELYPASEGFIALQDTRADPGLRLCSDIHNFYEFIPLERIFDDNPPAYMCHEVEKGQRYVVCMSTCAGLWRYIIGDVVMFDSVCSAPEFARGGDAGHGDGPARLRIVGRHRHFINAFGENLIVENIENAVAAAARATGLEVGEFTAAPVYPTPTTRAGHELVVEMPAPPDEPRLSAFARAYDESLKAQCVDYGIKRTGELGMQSPTITVVPMGRFHAWMAARGKLGGQHKVPRCANQREYVDGVRAPA